MIPRRAVRLVGLCAVGAALEAETYLDHRWLVASLAGSANFQVFVGPGAGAARGVAAEACAALSPLTAACEDAATAWLEEELFHRPSFLAACSAAQRGEAQGEGDESVEIVSPRATQRVALRGETLKVTWRPRVDDAEAGAACFAIFDQTGTLHGATCVTDLPRGGSVESVSTPVQRGAYVVYAQLRNATDGSGVGGLARRSVSVLALGERGWGSGQLALAFRTEEPRPSERAWLSASLAELPAGARQGASLNGSVFASGGDLELVLRYSHAMALAACADLGVDTDGVYGCAHGASSGENDLGEQLGCVQLLVSAAVSNERDERTVRFSVAPGSLLERLRRARRPGASQLPLALSAHAETREHTLEIARVGLSATHTSYVALAVHIAPSAEEKSGFADLDLLHAVVSPFETQMGGSFDKPRKQRALRAAVSSKEHPLYCESGFNAGYSALAALSANAQASVLAFDLGAIGTVAVAFDWIRATFPERDVHVVLGDSCAALADARRRLGARKCDVVFVDGGHTLETARCDLAAFAALAAPDAVLLVDDVNPLCATDFPPGLCDGPLLAWREAVAAGSVLEDYCDEEDYCVGRFAARVTPANTEA